MSFQIELDTTYKMFCKITEICTKKISQEEQKKECDMYLIWDLNAYKEDASDMINHLSYCKTDEEVQEIKKTFLPIYEELSEIKKI